MKLLILMLAIASTLTFAKDIKNSKTGVTKKRVPASSDMIQAVEAETKVIKLVGKFATVKRPSKTGDDRATIKKCGKEYSVLLLDNPIKFKLESMEDNQVSQEIVVQYIRPWGNLKTTQLEDEYVEVEGVIGQELMGECSPGIAIEDPSFYPNAKR